MVIGVAGTSPAMTSSGNAAKNAGPIKALNLPPVMLKSVD
jgi:hypothetical protein